MSNVQLTGSKTFYSHIVIYYCTQKNDVSMDKQFQKHLYMEHCKHGVIYQGKYRKIASKINWKDRECHVQDNSYVTHKDVKMYYDTNQFQELQFCGSHKTPHGARGLIKKYHLRFDSKLKISVHYHRQK